MGDKEEFNTLAFEKKLMHLKDTQESIQGLSTWCLKQRSHHKKIVSSWLNVLKRVKTEQRLVLFYLANDVIQYSKRKGYEFVESWGLYLQKATPLVREEKVRPKILRIFKIWEQRLVYDDEFLTDLTGLLSAGAIKKADDDPLDFQPQQLVNKIKQCQVLESDTDLRLKKIHEHPLELNFADILSADLKERCLKEDVEKDLAEGVACVEKYTQALQREIVARETLLALLTSANQYYSTQRGEVKVVAYAYKNFGSRVRVLKRKLDELTPSLPNAAPSPPPRDEDVPSPGPDEDIDLPAPPENNDGHDDISYNIDRTFNTSLAADGSLYNLGLSSFLTSDNPMSLFTETNNIANKIEVINSRPVAKPDLSILNEFLKNVTNDSNPASENNSVTSGTLSQKSQDTLPGLDLLTPESGGNPAPPTSFYGSMDQINDEPDQPYRPESASWSTSNWTVPTAVPPPPVMPVLLSGRFDTPESPPHAAIVATTEPLVYPLPEIVPPADVDHRGALPPPPPPPVLPLLGHIEDVDHRMLSQPSASPSIATNSSMRHSGHQAQDVDHRNLISLTHQPTAVPRPMNTANMDQDYRVPAMVPPVVLPSDIVESVDMDLSEDEDQQGMYNQQSQEQPRRQSFNNNKVLVGGDNGKTIHEINTNLIEINSEKKESQSAPVISQMVNPFDAMPPCLQRLSSYSDSPEDDDVYEEDLRSRGIENEKHLLEKDWQQETRQFTNQRFPRNWAPRTFRPPGLVPQQFWPRNGPRPVRPRWPGPRQRFW